MSTPAVEVAEHEPLGLRELERFDALEGLISPRAGRALAALAQLVPAGQVIVELGSYMGKSSCYLASGRAHVFAIDAWDLPGNPTGRFLFGDAYDGFERQIAEVDMEDRISPIRGFTIEIAQSWPGWPIGLLFIDADHGETNPTAPLDDFRAWRPHLADGAIVVFDDWDARHPSVVSAVGELRGEGLEFERHGKRLAVTRVTTKGSK